MESCRKCQHTKFYLERRGANQIGMYCAQCNSWAKWVGKKEQQRLGKDTIIHTEGSRTQQVTATPTQPTPTLQEVQTYCSCGHTDFYYAQKATNVGKYCKNCHKWSTWISKQQRQALQARGVEILETQPILNTNQVYSNTYMPSPSDNDKVDYIQSEYEEIVEDEMTSIFEDYDIPEYDGLTTDEKMVHIEHQREVEKVKALDCTTCTSGVLDILSSKNLVAAQLNADNKLIIITDKENRVVYGHAQVNYCPSCGRRL